nr:cytochrome c oxidase subunit II [Rufusia pilicola]
MPTLHLECDAPTRWELSFQDSATPIMAGIVALHHELMFVLVAAVTVVLWLLCRGLLVFTVSDRSEGSTALACYFQQHTVLELAWTLVPSFVLVAIAVPSFALLFSIDDVSSPSLTAKAIGHQWYWSYEYSDYCDSGRQLLHSSESYMLPCEEMATGGLRLLETDVPLALPIWTHVRMLVTSSDVLHSFAVPSLGIKCDAVPGRLNQVAVLVLRDGIFFGQCSEICGIQHGFMPIVLDALPLDSYLSWLAAQLV